MEPVSAQEKQYQLYLEMANKAKEAYSQHYTGLVANLSLVHLEDFAKILKTDNVTFNKEMLLKDFQENLLKDVINSMERSWETCNISQNIATLEMMKQKFKDRAEPCWRPYGKTVEEQTLPIRMQWLENKRRYLQKQIDFQNSKLDELLKHNLMYRNEIERINVQRSFIREQMHRGTAELENLKVQYNEMIDQIRQKY